MDSRPGSEAPIRRTTPRIVQLILDYVKPRRDALLVLLAVAAVAAGLILGFISLIPRIEFGGSTEQSWTLSQLSEQNGSFSVALGLSEVRLTNSSCAIFVTLLNEPQLEEFQSSGARPDPQLDCDTRITTFRYPLRWIIVENRGSASETFQVAATSYRVTFPWALLAIPAFPMALAGTLFLALKGLQRGIGKIRTEMESRDRESKKR